MSFLAVIKKHKPFQFKNKANPHEQLGRTVGVVWEYQGYGPEKTACIVQIKKDQIPVRVTIYDPNDLRATSVTNFFEHIATGVYHEHLREFAPHQIQFYHRDAIGMAIPQWGERTVTLTWDGKTQMFIHPEWSEWKPDESKSNLDEAFIYELRLKAAVAAEAYMRERHERGEITPREKELYDAFQRYLSSDSITQKYNLKMNLV